MINIIDHSNFLVSSLNNNVKVDVSGSDVENSSKTSEVFGKYVGDFAALPRDVKCYIFSYLELIDFHTYATVCKEWRNLFTVPRLWAAVYSRFADLTPHDIKIIEQKFAKNEPLSFQFMMKRAKEVHTIDDFGDFGQFVYNVFDKMKENTISVITWIFRHDPNFQIKTTLGYNIDTESYAKQFFQPERYSVQNIFRFFSRKFLPVTFTKSPTQNLVLQLDQFEKDEKVIFVRIEGTLPEDLINSERLENLNEYQLNCKTVMSKIRKQIDMIWDHVNHTSLVSKYSEKGEFSPLSKKRKHSEDENSIPSSVSRTGEKAQRNIRPESCRKKLKFE